MLLLAAYNTQKEKYEVITVPFCKQNPEEIKKKKKKPGLGWVGKYLLHISSLSSHQNILKVGKKWPQGRDQIVDVAVRPFVKMCEIFKLVFGKPAQLS